MPGTELVFDLQSLDRMVVAKVRTEYCHVRRVAAVFRRQHDPPQRSLDLRLKMQQGLIAFHAHPQRSDPANLRKAARADKDERKPRRVDCGERVVDVPGLKR